MKTIAVLFFMIIVAVIITCFNGPVMATETQDTNIIMTYPVMIGLRMIQLVEPADEHWWDGLGGGLVDCWWWLRK